MSSKIEELVNIVKIRPMMLVETVRIDYINYFIDGYLSTIQENEEQRKSNVPQTLDIAFKAYFYCWVFKWLIKNNRICEINFVWYKMFRSVTDSEDEAIKLFIDTSEEFFSMYHNKTIDWENIKEWEDVSD